MHWAIKKLLSTSLFYEKCRKSKNQGERTLTRCTIFGTQLKGGMAMESKKIAAALAAALSKQFNCIVEITTEGE